MTLHSIQPHHCVAPSDSLRHAMSCINQSGLGLVFVCDAQEQLMATLSDGDIRRALLGGAQLDAVVEPYMNITPHSCSGPLAVSQLFELFQEGGIKVIPVKHEEYGKLSGYYLFQDLVLARATRGLYTEELQRREHLDMVAVLMAGGLGSRMLSLTKNTPKPMLLVGGKPILERTIEHLRGCGIREFVFTVRYLADQIKDHFGDGSKWGVSIEYLREDKRMGTAGALTMLRERLTSPFLVMNGDLLTGADVGNMLTFHRSHGAQLSVAGRHHTINVPYGVLEATEGKVSQLVEKPDYDFFVNAGIYILDPVTLEHIPEETFYDITELISKLIERDDCVMCYPLIEEWMDIGRPADLERAERLLSGPDP